MDKFNEIIQKCLIDVITDIGFVNVAIDPRKKMVKVDKDWVTLRITVLMPFLGEMILSLPPQMAQQMAKNALDKLAIGQQSSYDIVAEILNVLVGKVFCEAAPHLLFELGLPEPILPHEISSERYMCAPCLTEEGYSFLFYHNLNFHQFPSQS